MTRVGIGYDVHGFGGEGPIVLGGVEIPYERGLKGHSDADVLLHAVMDAMLGAAALKDIGRQFPDTDVRFKGADSSKLLGEVRTMIEDEAMCVANLDCIIIVERPRLAKYIDRIRSRLAELAGVDVAAVGVKAKTNEGFGYIGEGEAIAAWAAVVLEPAEKS
ncbi:MAG: 2-C-methyl-D-erythritol 2,4-cyclodiphosphate synthase [Candidatus Zixiibacteriota bacterium]|jgi:2-C-methyl-D-erythritol 2,4-cyclodiphosphate synthase